MPLNSVQTNTGAASAVRSMAGVGRELAVTRERLTTGLKISSVRDDRATWAIAQKQRGDARALGSVLTSLQRGQSITGIALSAGETVIGLLTEMKERALSAADTTLSDQARAALNADFGVLRDRIAKTLKEADFNGVNLVDSGARETSVLAGLQLATPVTLTAVVPGGGSNAGGNGNGNGNENSGGNGGNGNGNGNGNGGGGGGNAGGGGQTTTFVLTTITPNRIELRAASLALGGPNVTVNAASSLATVADAGAALQQVETSLLNVTSAVSAFGTDAARVDRQIMLVSKVRDRLESGVGDLVDADAGRETARLRALQVREQLAVRSLSIANTAPSALLGLFRG
jgi:flagellin